MTFDGLDELIGRPYACWQPVIPEPNNVRWCSNPKGHDGNHKTVWRNQFYVWQNSASVTPTKENVA